MTSASEGMHSHKAFSKSSMIKRLAFSTSMFCHKQGRKLDANDGIQVVIVLLFPFYSETSTCVTTNAAMVLNNQTHTHATSGCNVSML